MWWSSLAHLPLCSQQVDSALLRTLYRNHTAICVQSGYILYLQRWHKVKESGTAAMDLAASLPATTFVCLASVSRLTSASTSTSLESSPASTNTAIIGFSLNCCTCSLLEATASYSTILANTSKSATDRLQRALRVLSVEQKRFDRCLSQLLNSTGLLCMNEFFSAWL